MVLENMHDVMKCLQARAALMHKVRDYFFRHQVMEVDVPALSKYTVTDVHLGGLPVSVNGAQHFLQTSPEYYMKQLLAKGSGSIFNLAKAYRADEVGKKHQPEFTMLEWYRVGFDDSALMTDLELLLQALGCKSVVERVAYRDVFMRYTGINPMIADLAELSCYAQKNLGVSWDDDSVNTWLDVIFSLCVEPNLCAPTIVYDFPAQQCALAKLAKNTQGEKVAKRFELYWQGIELANGYWELTCPIEQRQRFECDNYLRVQKGLPEIPINPDLMAALDSGLPECAGVALGVDRLLMCLLDVDDIRNVSVFNY